MTKTPETPNGLSPRQMFKVAFIANCLDEGMNTAQTLQAARIARRAAEQELVKSALGELEAGAAALMTGASHFGQSSVPYALAALAAPWGLGYAGGRVAGNLKDQLEDPDAAELQKNDLLTELQRLKRVSESNKAIAEYQQQRQRTNRYFM